MMLETEARCCELLPVRACESALRAKPGTVIATPTLLSSSHIQLLQTSPAVQQILAHRDRRASLLRRGSAVRRGVGR